VRSLRGCRELTIRGLAAAADIRWTHLSGIESGKRNPSWSVIAALAAHLEVPASKLIRLAQVSPT
jgi:transcriptional regulator with XRE-family HTH domain